ncbi:class I SAM-dependent methyltransferase [Mycolicibacterium neworleansense]|uniref:Transcriptional regulator n=1 Tax=Mycolicibacterium neworleansense TaxID=146018 RepID=A0A0H5RQV0_9MYCO|nr:class I SAM-dependent methyltransferase [Mycolicibacterium neworleansense]MCV7365846.1 class I SAM-dependent methyltransferase [Mycolicibacterium neworleansense]CRZ16545.1 transcriptional regulator [Mycolicibacterium neworleansense]
MANGTDQQTTPETVEGFSERITSVIDSAGLTLLLSLGHQAGLFDAMAKLPSATSTEIADAASLDERYVREWLGGVVAARVVDYDAESSTYRLPAHRAEVLTRAGGLNNLARLAQYVPLMCEVEQKILGCFRDGGGLSYDDYPRFHTVMAERSSEVFDAALIDAVLPLVDGLPRRLESGIDVADFGCGSGYAICLMAQAYPASRFTGIDFSEEATATGAAAAAQHGLTNASFLPADLAALDQTAAYDLITAFDAIHDQAQPARVLENIYRALRPGGVLVMADIKASSRLEDNIGVAMSTYRYAVSLTHCMSVSLGLGGSGLGTMWGRQLAVSMLADAGFSDVEVAELEQDPSNYYYLARK